MSLRGNLRKTILLIMVTFSLACSEELVVDLTNGLVFKGEFRGLKKNRLYLEHADSLIIIQRGVIDALILNSLTVEFEDLSDPKSSKINFNRFAGFLEVNDRTLNFYSTMVLARSSCPGCNPHLDSLPPVESYSRKGFISEPSRFPVLPF